MPEIVDYSHSEETIFVVGFGKITYSHVKETIKQALKYIEDYQVKNVISNHLNVESVPQEVDIFNLGAMIGQIFKGLNITLIYPSRFKEYYSMFAQAANKRGGNIKLLENAHGIFNYHDIELAK